MLYTLTLLSGAAALSHELLWTRRLIDLLGAAGDSTARVLGATFLGFAAGGLIAARWVGALEHPWRRLAIVEVGIASTSLVALTLPAWTGWLWPWLGGPALVSGTGTTLKTVLSLAVVLPPSVLMGTTLPLLAKAALHGERRLGRQGIFIYAVNTCGGVLGLVATALLTLPLVGVAGAMAVAMVLNVLASVLAIALHIRERGSRRGTGRRPVVSASLRPRESLWQTLMPPGLRTLAPLLAIAFLSGVAVLAMEVLILHAMGNVLPSSFQGTTALLAIVVAMLAGSALMTPGLVGRFGPAERLLPWALLVAGITTASTPLIFFEITDGMGLLVTGPTVARTVARLFGLTLVTSGLCFIAGGFVLPLVFGVAGESSGDPYGRRWGWLLAANGVGGAVGAELANRVLVPTAGIHVAMAAVGAAYAVGALALLAPRVGAPHGARNVLVSLVGLGLVALIGWVDRRLPLVTTAPDEVVHEVRSGREGVVAVVERAGSKRLLLRNHYTLGGDSAYHHDRRQMLIPLVLHATPERVATIGLATGTTSAAALDHPSVSTVTAVELSPLVTDLARRHFTTSTRDAFADPRFNVVVEDGRTWIAAMPDSYDVIVGDLFLPWATGVGRLYSLEHFESVRRSLRDGGIFAQWLPMYQLTPNQFRTIVSTFAAVFDETHLFRGGFQAESGMLGLVGRRDGQVNVDEVPPRLAAVRAYGYVVDPWLRHEEGLRTLYFGKLIPGPLTSSATNDLNNSWFELDAGLHRLGLRRYMVGGSWIAASGEIHKHTAPGSAASTGGVPWREIGLRLMTWRHAALMGDPAARSMAGPVLSQLPDSMIQDEGADWSDWAPVEAYVRERQSQRDLQRSTHH